VELKVRITIGSRKGKNSVPNVYNGLGAFQSFVQRKRNKKGFYAYIEKDIRRTKKKREKMIIGLRCKL